MDREVGSQHRLPVERLTGWFPAGGRLRRWESGEEPRWKLPPDWSGQHCPLRGPRPHRSRWVLSHDFHFQSYRSTQLLTLGKLGNKKPTSFTRFLDLNLSYMEQIVYIWLCIIFYICFFSTINMALTETSPRLHWPSGQGGILVLRWSWK